MLKDIAIPVTRKQRDYIVCRMFTEDEDKKLIPVGFSVFNSKNDFIEYAPTLMIAQKRCDELNKAEEEKRLEMERIRDTEARQKKEEAAGKDDDYPTPWPSTGY